ncbi:hypothetical protein SP21_41 [Salmonella phage 21]|nr:hypothetical protein SP21_41 [Salmonella phage 21]
MKSVSDEYHFSEFEMTREDYLKSNAKGTSNGNGKLHAVLVEWRIQCKALI